jgi:hypothetical protein
LKGILFARGAVIRLACGDRIFALLLRELSGFRRASLPTIATRKTIRTGGHHGLQPAAGSQKSGEAPRRGFGQRIEVVIRLLL